MGLRASRRCLFLSLFITLMSWDGVKGQSCTPYDYAHDWQFLCPCHLFYGAEGLYWTIFQTNLDYAVSFKRNQSLELKKTHFFHHDWKWGVRLWMGWNWGCNWETRWIYSWYLSKNRGSKESSDSTCGLKGSLLYPTKERTPIKRASGYNQIKYQTVDWEAGNVLSFCGHTWILRPFIAWRFLRLEQTLKVNYKCSGFLWKRFDIVKWKSRLNTMGLHGGVEMNLRCANGLGLYGTLAGSLLGGRTRNRHWQGETKGHKREKKGRNGKPVIDDINLREKRHVAIPELDLSAGFSWDYDDRHCVLYKLKLGYELENYFLVPQLRRYQGGSGAVSNSADAGQIAFHGVTFSAEIYF
ncbi:MAG: Lpg1974 family pore-forming outer membrane protein [Waddliaceae bacterium]